jgi:hypothetical protein
MRLDLLSANRFQAHHAHPNGSNTLSGKENLHQVFERETHADSQTQRGKRKLRD